MRISDWSSDVCSSDLRVPPGGRPERKDDDPPRPPGHQGQDLVETVGAMDEGHPSFRLRHGKAEIDPVGEARPAFDIGGRQRSEEHTSELQSLMRISYAGFLLEKKTQKKKKNEYKERQRITVST